jgi:uncharacterized RDD family membrane protein YckC
MVTADGSPAEGKPMTYNPYTDTTAYPPSTAPSPHGAPAPDAQRQWPFAGWGSRVAASLIDALVSLVGGIPYVVGVVMFIAGSPDSSTYDTPQGPSAADTDPTLMVVGGLLALVGLVVMFGIQVWNRWIKQGRTGQSVGKKVMSLYLVDQRTGNPIGAGMAFVRDLAHFLDGIFYVGYLWPLWDPKKQTFADKLVGTVVAHAPKS